MIEEKWELSPDTGAFFELFLSGLLIIGGITMSAAMLNPYPLIAVAVGIALFFHKRKVKMEPFRSMCCVHVV